MSLLSQDQYGTWSEQIRPLLVQAAERPCGADAEMVAQDAIVRGLMGLRRFNSDDGLDGLTRWLRKILSRAIADWTGERSRFVPLDPDTLQCDRWTSWIDGRPDPDLTLEAGLRLRHVSFFNPLDRDCLILHLHGFTVKDSAELLDVSIKSVRYHRTEAVRALKAVKLAAREWGAAIDLDPHKWKGQKVTIYHPPPKTGSGLAKIDLRLGKCSADRPDQLDPT